MDDVGGGRMCSIVGGVIGPGGLICENKMCTCVGMVGDWLRGG